MYVFILCRHRPAGYGNHGIAGYCDEFVGVIGSHSKHGEAYSEATKVVMVYFAVLQAFVLVSVPKFILVSDELCLVCLRLRAQPQRQVVVLSEGKSLGKKNKVPRVRNRNRRREKAAIKWDWRMESRRE